MTCSFSNPSPGMAPPSRSPALPHLQSPITARDIYTSATPRLHRTSELHSRSPSVSGVRGVPLSPSSSGGFASPNTMDSSIGNNPSPPLHPTEVIHQLQASDGQIIRPEIFGRIDKGFFIADNDWTCYRRNYFSLNCSYTLHPSLPNGNIHLLHHAGSSPQVTGFALSISAVVDGREGKSTDLIQHTPKRDKGPQATPGRIPVAPRPPPSAGMYGGDGGLGGPRSLYDTSFGQNPNAPQTEATFERIQFKNATANNGKRRAAQQYYHLLIELSVDIGAQHGGERWVKIASRMSVPMVVRGRSPGHYHSERRGSNASTGPGGSGGAGGGGSYPPGGSSRTPGDMSMSGQPPMGPGPSFSSSHDSRMHHFRSPIAPSQMPLDSTMSPEEARSIDEAPCYMYYPGAIYEGQEGRYQLPSVSEYAASKVKQEYGNGTGPRAGYALPSITGGHDSLGRQCGRWEGSIESKGYFPPALLQQEMNIT
jgi:meiosis-specific transcription factor NDT80